MPRISKEQIERNALEKAVSIAGGQSALARLIRVRPQAVQQWCRKGRVSRKHERLVHEVTGVSRDELRVD